MGDTRGVTKPRILYVVHNHPSVRPGGAEAYAFELYEAMRTSGEFEPILLAKGGPPLAPVGHLHEGTQFAPVNDDPSQYFFYTDGYEFDWLFGTMTGKEIYTKHFHSFLKAFQPDIVHFQHTLHLGYDLIRQVKTSLPETAIVYTLHEFLPICHRQGQMVRTFNNDELCTHASPRRCHECYPDISPQSFFLRQRFIQSHFALVDCFIAPSNFLAERYVAWGIPREKILVEEHGRLPLQRIQEPDEERPRNRIGFFGQITPFKGVHVLLRAMRLLCAEASLAKQWPRTDLTFGTSLTASLAVESDTPDIEPHLYLHGTNLEQQGGSFQNEVRELLQATKRNVTFVGRYSHANLPTIMANIDWVVVPSIWWENSPLVIQEAFAYGRPVICSDIGGMAEKVIHGETGLHFRVHDEESLARTIKEAVSSPGLWDRLRQGITGVHPMKQHLRVLAGVYHGLLGGAPTGDNPVAMMMEGR
jgi:glycosyltransferase involved in cell wall biosynthesis